MYKKLPRAPGDKICAIQGNVWNQAADEINAFSRLSVAPPLMLSVTPTGPLLSIAAVGRPVVINITSAASGAGWYGGKIQRLQSSITIDPTTDLDWSTYYQNAGSGSEDAWFADWSENTHPPGSHYSLADGSVYTFGWPWGYADGRTVYQGTINRSYTYIPCTCSQDGGSAGSNSPPTAATFTYTCTAGDGTLIAHNVPLAFARWPLQMTAGSHGIFCLGGPFANQLAVVDEVPSVTQCSS